MIAVHKVRHYGEAVAVVVAEDRYIAEDACDLIDVVYEPLPAVLDPFAASDEDAPLLHDALGTNVAYERTFTFGDVDGTFERAPRKVQARLRWPRSTAMPMDTNGAIGDYDRGTGVVTVWANSMNFTYFQWLLAACLKVPTSKLNVLPVAAGGSFGSKFFMHKVPCLAGFLSKLVGRPVKYVEDRIDHIVNNDHAGSDRHYDAELAFDDDGTFRALRIRVVDDYGAYLQFGTGTHGNSLSQIVGPYRIGEVEYSLQAVLTNKNQQGAYRGFGAEVSNWVLERLVDFAAPRPRGRPRGAPPSEPHRRRTSSPTARPPATSTTAATTRASSRRSSRRPTTRAGSPSATARGPRGATSGSASSRRRSAACSAPRSSGSGSTSRRSRRRRARRARACRSTRPGRSP